MRLVPRRLRACLAVLVLSMLSLGLAHAVDGGDQGQSCRHGDRGRLLGFDRVASHPTAADARAYFDSWIDFYRDFHQFPPDLAVGIDHGFDT